MGWVDGKTALVTGGGSGIGRAVVDRFIAEGAKVGVLERVPGRVADLAASFGGNVHAVEGDAVSFADNQRAVRETVASFGGLDVLVANVGVFDYFLKVTDIEAAQVSEAFDELMALNVKSYLFAAKAAWPYLSESGGSMIFTVSNAGFYAGGGGALYTASKFAVRGLVVQLAHEFAPSVRVNGVAPGGTLTDIRGLKALGLDEMSVGKIPDIESKLRGSNPLGIISKPADHAWAYVYLASNERAPAVTGTIIHSDGGMGVRGVGLT